VSHHCPRCGSEDVHHSRFRTWIDRLRFNITGQVPFRCHQCDWRGWRQDRSRPGESLREVHRQLTDAEIERIEIDASRR